MRRLVSSILLAVVILAWMLVAKATQGWSGIPETLEVALRLMAGVAIPLVFLLVFVRGLLSIPEYLLELPERRRIRRIARGECGRCGYSLRGNVSGMCPECGEPCLRRNSNS